MASLANDGGTKRRIIFNDSDGSRRTIRLNMPKRQAEAVKLKVEDLATAKLSGGSPSDATARWLATIDATLHEKIAAVGLVESREAKRRATLGAFIDGYIAERTDVKPLTVKKDNTTRDLLIEHFGQEKRLASITPGDADAWRRVLGKTRSENTVRKHIAVAKTFLSTAVRKRWIDANPFEDQKATIQPNRERFYFVSQRKLIRC